MAYTAIDDPSAHFQTVLWSGSGSGQAITNGGNSDLQPDFVWLKKRAGGSARAHQVYDSTRGVTKYLHSNTTAAEGTFTDGLTAFGSDGFTVGDGDGTDGSGGTYVAWQWKANGGTRTTNTESGNDQAGGYQANTTGGFSIVDYVGTGAAGTMAHGLGAVPHMIIIKNRDETQNWCVYHHKNTAAPETDILDLGTSAATYDNVAYWNDTAPTSSVFTTNTSADVNKNDINYISYIWTEIQGYSKFGKYTANDSADGPFVYTGFKPAWLMIKSEAAISWYIMDNARSTSNPVIAAVNADNNAAEFTNQLIIDFLSNGFKIRNDNSGSGASVNHTTYDPYLYMAFAEQPFVTSGGVPCTAR